MGRNKRTKQKKALYELDLHGVKHVDVRDKLENFIFLHEPPFDIITGNSMAMKGIVRAILYEHKFKHHEGDYFNRGYIRVLV